MEDINNITDYIILKFKSDGSEAVLSHLKLQKLLYYTQAWYLAFYGEPLFEEKFQAWVHGPVSRVIFDRFNSSKYIYSELSVDDVENKEVYNVLSEDSKRHIDSILEVYARFSGTDLEYMTHSEDPWMKARNGLNPFERCENEIDEGLMKNYYKARLSKSS